MKKLVSIVLALVMVLSLGTVAFATENDNAWKEKLDQGTSFTKNYKVNYGTAPAETFNFTATFVKAVDNEGTAMAGDFAKPTVTLGGAAFGTAMAANATAYTADANVTITDYANCALGVYTYQIKETKGDTAGVNYEAKPVYLVVTILNDGSTDKHYVAAIHYETENGEKTGGTTNTYDAGKLTVSKTITGAKADMGKKFPFTITLTAPTGTKFNQDVQNTYNLKQLPVGTTVTDNINDSQNIITINVNLGHDESLTIDNIPAGTTYTVEEVKGAYTPTFTWSDNTKTIDANDTDTVAVENNLGGTPDTGITMDTIPYIVVLAVAALGLVAFVANKRRAAEF